MKRGKRISIIVVILIVLILLLVSAIQYIHHVSTVRILTLHDQSSITANSPQERKNDILSNSSKFMQLEFPHSAELLYAVPLKGGFPNPYACAIKLQMNRNDVDFFIGEIRKHSQIEGHQSGVGEDRRVRFNVFRRVGTGDAWHPQSAKNTILGSINYNTQSGVPFLSILVDLDRSEIAVVYLHYGAF